MDMNSNFYYTAFEDVKPGDYCIGVKYENLFHYRHHIDIYLGIMTDDDDELMNPIVCKFGNYHMVQKYSFKRIQYYLNSNYEIIDATNLKNILIGIK